MNKDFQNEPTKTSIGILKRIDGILETSDLGWNGLIREELKQVILFMEYTAYVAEDTKQKPKVHKGGDWEKGALSRLEGAIAANCFPDVHPDNKPRVQQRLMGWHAMNEKLRIDEILDGFTEKK